MARLLNYFLRGLIVLAPLAVSLYVTWWLFTGIDGILGIPIPGLGFVVTILLITLVGFLASNLLTRGLVGMLERLMTRLPLVRLLYSSTKDLLNAFVGEKRRFDKPVLVALLAGSDVKALGFVTQETLEQLGIADHAAVYFPQSYNFAGQVLMVPSVKVTRLDANSSAVMAFVVSGGVTAIPGGETEISPARPGA